MLCSGEGEGSKWKKLLRSCLVSVALGFCVIVGSKP